MDNDKKKILIYAGGGLLVLIIIVIIVSLLSGGKKNAGTTAVNTKGQKITLNFWDPLDDPSVFKDIIKGYAETNPNVKVNIVTKPLLNYKTESTQAIAAGKGPDIWLIPNDSIFENKDLLSSAPEGLFTGKTQDTNSNNQYIKENFVPIVGQENMFNNKVYGIPLFVDTLALYVNSSLMNARKNDYFRSNVKFDENIFTYGPSTWNDLVTLVKEYTVVNNGIIQKSAIALGRNDNVNHAPDILALLMLQDGATMTTTDGLTATFNLPASTQTDSKYYPGSKALEFFTSFSNPNAVNYTWNNNFPDSYDAFRDGQTAMMIDYESDSQNLKQQNPNLDFRIWPLPQIQGEDKAKDFASYWTLTVPKTGLEADNPKACQVTNPPLPCEKKLAAWDFVNYLQGTGLSSYSANTGLPSPKIQAGIPKSALLRINSGNPFRFQSQTAVSWYRGQDPDKIETEFNAMISNVVDNHVDPQSAVDVAAQHVSNILRLRAGFTTTPNTTPQKATQ